MQTQEQPMTPYHTVTPYVIVSDAEAFLAFMEMVFGARIQRKEVVPGRGIMHAEAVIGDSVIMTAEATEQWKICTTGIFLLVSDVDGTYRAALEEGAVSVAEPAEQSYGRSCGVQDPFGNIWWITAEA
jgi:uncharacterized glyoxalase superfamily protein PhnB